MTDLEHALDVRARLLQRRAPDAPPMPARELRLRERIDRLTDERDRARAEALRYKKILAGRVKTKEARAELMRDLVARGWSYPKIARALGVHHTTVMYWCTGIRERRRTNGA